MAVLLEPGKGQYREPPPTAEHSRYPLHMDHPGFQPGVPDREIKVMDPQTGRPTGQLIYTGSKPIRYAPVLVHDADQEAGHAAQGYRPVGKSDPAAFAKAVASAAPPVLNYQPDEYPKWVNGQVANNLEEEAALLGEPRIHAGGKPEAVLKSLTSPDAPEQTEGEKAALVDAAVAEDKAKDAGKTNEQLRIEYLEAQLEEMRAEMRAMRAMSAPVATYSEVSAALDRLDTSPAPAASTTLILPTGAEVEAITQEVAAEASREAMTELDATANKVPTDRFVRIPETDTHAAHLVYVPVVEENVTIQSGETVRQLATSQPSDDEVVAQALAEQEVFAKKKARSDAIKAGMARRKQEKAATA